MNKRQKKKMTIKTKQGQNEKKALPALNDVGKRFIHLEATRNVDEENRTIEMSFASEEPYRRWGYIEVVSMETINLDRLNDGGALLFNHDSTGGHIGVVERAWVDDNKIARCVVRFGNSPLAKEKFQDVKDGILTKVSYGYRVNKYTLIEENEDGLDTYKVDVEALEVSFVPVPADATIGLGKSNDIGNDSAVTGSDNNLTLGVPEMSQKNTVEAAKDNIVDTDKIKKEAFLEGQKAQSAYESEVRNACKLAGFSEKAETFIKENTKMSIVLDTLTELKAKKDSAEVKPTITSGDTDNHAMRRQELVKQVSHILDPKQPASDLYRSIRGPQQVFKALEMERGNDVSLLNGQQLSEKLFGQRDMSTSDFTSVLVDAQHNTLGKLYDSLANYNSFSDFVSMRMAADYRDLHTSRISEAPAMEKIAEGSEYPMGAYSDSGEKHSLDKWGIKLAFTDRAMINDSLGGIQRSLNALAASAVRKEADLVYSELNSGLIGGAALYSAGNVNLSTTTDLTVDGVSTVEAKLGQQTGPGGAHLNLTGAYLVVNPTEKTKAKKIVGDISADSSANFNPFSGEFKVLVDSRVPAGTWYMIANNMLVDTIELAKMYERPVIDQRVNFDTDSLEFKMKYPLSAKVLDFRGLQKATIA